MFVFADIEATHTQNMFVVIVSPGLSIACEGFWASRKRGTLASGVCVELAFECEQPAE